LAEHTPARYVLSHKIILLCSVSPSKCPFKIISEVLSQFTDISLQNIHSFLCQIPYPSDSLPIPNFLSYRASTSPSTSLSLIRSTPRFRQNSPCFTSHLSLAILVVVMASQLWLVITTAGHGVFVSAFGWCGGGVGSAAVGVAAGMAAATPGLSPALQITLKAEDLPLQNSHATLAFSLLAVCDGNGRGLAGLEKHIK
jgi:hypothetical protein